MKNIKIEMAKPYRTDDKYQSKISFEAEFDDAEIALTFMTKLTQFIKENRPSDKGTE